VQHADLAAIAVSPDGRWLIAGAGTGGVGIQDVARRRWLTLEDVAPADRPSVVTHAAWWGDRFYVGGPDGVLELNPDREPRAFQRVAGLAGSVVALEPTVDEGLFVLHTVPCGNGPKDCTRLSVLNARPEGRAYSSSPLARPTVLIDERNRFSELTLDKTLFVEQWKEHLVLAGAGGIFDYDTQRRSWNRLSFDTITAIGSCRTASCFYFGYAGRTGGVGLLTPKTLTGGSPVRWVLPGEQPARIAARAEGNVAVLAASGRGYVLGPGQPPVAIHPGTSSAIPFDRFRDAVAFGDAVLLFGAPGAVLHDVSRRSYRALAAPEWLRSSDAIVRASGAYLFGLERRGRAYAAHVVPQRQVELGTLVLSTATPAMVDGPIRAVDASSPGALRVIDGTGRVVSIGANGLVPMTGGRVAAIADGPPLDVAGSPEALAVATASGVRVYSGQSRSWTEPVMVLPPGEHAVELARMGGGWVARSSGHRLVSGGAKTAVLIGGDAGAVPAGPLTDVLVRGNDVYLAWAGGIARYDTRARHVASYWPIDPVRPVRVDEIVRGEPVSLAGDIARIGSREIARGVHRLFVNEANLWLTREDRGRRYLEVLPVASISRPTIPPGPPGAPVPLSPRPAPACLFRNPTAGADVTELRDARALPGGLVAVTTNAGLKLYSGQRRSWYGLEPDSRRAAGRGRIYALGATVLVADAAGALTSLQIIRSGVGLPDSCAAGPARFEQPPDVLDVRSVAVDERRRRAIVLRPDGAVDEISERGISSLLSAPGDGPREAEMVRAWHFPDVAPSVLWVATSRHLWQYDLMLHAWFRLDVALEGFGPLAGGTPIDVQPQSNGLVAIATRETGARYGDALPLRPGERQAITLKPLAPPGQLRSGPAGSAAGARSDRPAASPVFTIGDVTFFREIHHGMLAVLRTEDGRSRSAYHAGRFVWDSGRRGVAIANDVVLVHSDAGVHSLRALTSFDPGPPGSPDASDRLDSREDLTPRFLRGGREYRRSIPGVWAAAGSPAPGATVVLRDDDREWIRQNGVLTVESVAGGRRSVLLTTTDGIGLAVDRLVSAAPYGGQVYVLTEGFLEIADPSAAGPPLGTVTREPAPPGTLLERLSVSGRDGLWLTSAGSVFSWNVDRRAFEPTPPDANPYRRRQLAEVGPLRFELDAGVVTVQLRTDDPQGNTSWKPVAFERGRFAFDVVRSVATSGSSLFVGTDAGLQIYDGTDLGLDRARIVALDSGTTPRATPVDRMGEPCTGTVGFVACSRSGCFQQSSERFVAALPGDALACRVRARSSLWSWTADAAGVKGRYTKTAVSTTSDADLPGLPVTLQDGRFPHDAIAQVVAFDSKLFTVWQGNQVGVHGTDLRLTSEVRNHQFTAAVRLVPLTDHVQSLRTPDRELAPALYAFEGARVWKYARAGWLPVADRDEIATVADYDANRPILQRRRLRLVRGGREGAVGFEMRMPGTPWTRLQWDPSANRFAIDVWQNIELSGDTLWIATPAGFVGRDGNWTFDPNAFRFVDAVPAEAGRAVTDLRIDGNSAEVRYDGDSTRVYRIVLDEHGGQQRPGRFTRRDADPFMERPFAVDSPYWSWSLTGRVGTSVGRVVATFKGEPIAISNGRFDFDSINSIAVFKGQLHVATTRRGWFESPATSAALEGLRRPDHPAIVPADVTMLHDNRDPKQRELCLRDATGQFARLSEDGATRRTQGCAVLAADTPFWRYTRDGATFRITAGGSAGRPGERRLIDGRFSDEVVIGPPVTGSKNDQPVTLVPTTAGVMWWNADGRPIDMQAPPFQGKPETPRLLNWVAGQPPAYVADGTLYSLEVDEKPRAAWTARLPQTGVFEKLGSGPGPLLWLDWSDNSRRHHTIVDPRNNSLSHDEFPIDARRLPAYFRRAMIYQAHDGLIRLRLRDKVIQAYAGADGWPIAEVDDSFQLLGGASHGTRAILIGPRYLLELNMDVIARAVYSGEKPRPPGSTKPRPTKQ
jgi:hypothetical protein